jgi:hypothetical protein
VAGDDTPAARPRHAWVLSARIFLALLGAVFLIAFLSLWAQVHGLVGSRGILPVTDLLTAARERLGLKALWQVPTLCWLDSSDGFLTALCATGVVAALLLIAGIAPAPMLIVLWSTYLSLAVAGQAFLSFQWDILLLETGFTSLFIAPWRLFAWRSIHLRPPPAISIWLLRSLLFKLMFLSGITKLLSGDPTWRGLTALDVHYQTQPLPTWIGWYVHQMPGWFQRASVVSMFVVELVVPFLIFGPRLLRALAAIPLLLLQVLIAATGNYGFFNLLAAVLCLTLIDDGFWRPLAPRRWAQRLAVLSQARPRRTGFHIAVAILAAPVFLASGLTCLREMVRTPRDATVLPAPVGAVLRSIDGTALRWFEPTLLAWIAPFRTISGYGLFRVMTTKRPEVILEVSEDGVLWQEWALGWKPGDPQRPPGFVAPHMPRLDWQMWFAALYPRGHMYWLERLIVRIFEGSPEVLGLLGDRPGGAHPDSPRFVRLSLYRYQFTDRDTRSRTGAWWQREFVGHLTPAISRDTVRARQGSGAGPGSRAR